MTDSFALCQEEQLLESIRESRKRNVKTGYPALMQSLRNHRMLQEQVERHDIQRRLMGRLKNHGTCRPCLLHLQPPRGTHAPAIAWLQTREPELWHRCQ